LTDFSAFAKSCFHFSKEKQIRTKKNLKMLFLESFLPGCTF
jgi:hypothetical protein